MGRFVRPTSDFAAFFLDWWVGLNCGLVWGLNSWSRLCCNHNWNCHMIQDCAGISIMTLKLRKASSSCKVSTHLKMRTCSNIYYPRHRWCYSVYDHFSDAVHTKTKVFQESKIIRLPDWTRAQRIIKLQTIWYSSTLFSKFSYIFHCHGTDFNANNLPYTRGDAAHASLHMFWAPYWISGGPLQWILHYDFYVYYTSYTMVQG